MKKALLVTRVSGFIPQHESNNVRILQQMGYEVHYAANFDTIVYGKDNHRAHDLGLICHQIDFCRSPFSPDVRKSYRQLKELMLKDYFDLIHCHMPMTGVVARKAAQAVRRSTGRKVPVIYTAHGLHFYSGAPLANWVYYPVERHYARYTDRLILINQEDYDRATHFPVRGSVEYTPGVGMNMEKYEPYAKTDWSVGSNAASDIHEHFGIPKDHAVIVSVGELSKRKNIVTMIDAMKELADLKLTYLICGQGPLEQQLKEHVRDAGVSDRVCFAGYVENVPAVLQQADCLVLPSFQEGLPVAVMEAMAVGLPVIATRIRGITDLLVHAKGGYLVDDWEPENYAVKVRRMFSEQEGRSKMSREVRREQMGRWNRERIREFSLDKVDQKMREIYSSLNKD